MNQRRNQVSSRAYQVVNVLSLWPFHVDLLLFVRSFERPRFHPHQLLPNEISRRQRDPNKYKMDKTDKYILMDKRDKHKISVIHHLNSLI